MGEGRVWFVTGCSTGIGRAVALALAGGRDKAAVSARRPDALADIVGRDPHRLRAARVDLTDHASIDSAVAQAVDAFGRIDVLVNNAGVGLLGAIEETDDGAFDRVFETNVKGTLRMLRSVLPIMRRQRSGHILTVTSVGGLRGRAGVGVYNASKFALEGIHEALAEEVAPLGIAVTLVEPGGVDSDFRQKQVGRCATRIEDYEQTVGPLRAAFALPRTGPTLTPEQVAAAIVGVVASDDRPLRLPLGRDTIDAMRHKVESFDRTIATWHDDVTQTS